MKNRTDLKKLLLTAITIGLLSMVLFVFINVREYRSYTKNYNERINAIVQLITEKYPDITKTEIVATINSSDNVTDNVLREYGFDLEKDDIVTKNVINHKKFLILNTSILLIIYLSFIIVLFMYDLKKSRQIRLITKYIGEINRKNYDLKIDDMSEDELSILKTEVYKTTVMLREIADNSVNDKVELKKSIEDISHQIKTPLTSIMIMLENIIDDPDMEADIREDFLRDIKKQAANINSLVQVLLKLSKFDANTVDFMNKECGLADIANEAINNVSVLCDIKNIEIHRQYEEDVKISCDYMWQVEALTNIIKNCVEHSDNDSSIDISIDSNNVYSQIKIRDYGMGMSKEEVDHVFERFYRGKNSSADSIGIGLALSKTIIEKSNGTIDVNTLDKGCMFVIKYYKI